MRLPTGSVWPAGETHPSSEVQMNRFTQNVSRWRLEETSQEEQGEENGRRKCGTVMKYSGTLLEQPSQLGRSADSGKTETVNNLYETDYSVL